MKKVNIREALLKLDRDSCCQYDLTTLYESAKLKDEDKVKLVQYIDAYEHPSVIGGFLESKCQGMNESFYDDDVSDIASAEKIIKEINENEVPLIFSDDIDDEEEVKTIPLTEEVIKSDAKDVRKYVWDKIQAFDSLTDDNSYYWEFEQDVMDGIAAKLVSDEIDIPDNAHYKFSLPEVGLNFFFQDTPEYCYYVVDKDAVEPFSKVDEAVEIGECPICNRKFAEGELSDKGACPKCGEYLHKTDSGAHEKTDDDIDESLTEGVGTYAIVGWLDEHPQAYDDALAYFKTNDLDKVKEEDLIDWIGEHDELYQDYLRFFKLEEGLWDDIKSVGKTVGKVAKKAWDNSYTKAIGTGLKKAYDKSDLGKATKEIGDSIKATDTYKKAASAVKGAKDFVKNNVGSKDRDPSKLSIEMRGKNYRMSDLKYKVGNKYITPQEYASMGMFKRKNVRVIVPKGVKPVANEELHLYEAFNLNEGIDTTSMEAQIKSVVADFMKAQGFDASEIDDYTAIEIKDIADDMIQVEVRAELSYEDLMELSNKLDPIVAEVDKYAYFEPVTSGIVRAHIRKDQSDDIVDEEAVAQWTAKFNKCKSIDDLREIYLIFDGLVDNGEYSIGTIDAILEVVYAKLDALNEDFDDKTQLNKYKRMNEAEGDEPTDDTSTEDTAVEHPSREYVGKRVSINGAEGVVIGEDSSADGKVRVKVKIGIDNAGWFDLDNVEHLEEDLDGPADKKSIERDLELLTNNFNDDFGYLRCAYEEEQKIAYDIMKQHYADVNMSKDGKWFIIDFGGDKFEKHKFDESVGRVITRQEILHRICELPDFKNGIGIRGLSISAQSMKPDWMDRAGLVSVECWDDNEVTVYSFAQGSRKEIYKTNVHSEEELDALVDRVAQIQEEQLAIYEATPEEHYINSAQYKERAARKAAEAHNDAIAEVVAKYPKAEFDSLLTRVMCKTEDDAKAICDELDFVNCTINKVRRSRMPYVISIKAKTK